MPNNHSTLPDKVMEFLESDGRSYSSDVLAKRFRVSARTMRTHLLALYESKKLVREYVYSGAIGRYYYFARPALAKVARR